MDAAGNAEDWRSVTVSVDRVAPVATASVRTDTGIALVTILARDAESGLARVEYESDGAGVREYATPLSFTETGVHAVRYRAVDAAGNASAWAVIEAPVRRWRPGSGYIAFASGPDGDDIAVYRPTHPGMPLFSDWRRGFAPAADDLPYYASGGDAPLLRSTDRGTAGETMAAFWAKRDITVYAFADSGAALPGWTIVETGLDIERRHHGVPWMDWSFGPWPSCGPERSDAFPGGASVYMKRFTSGSFVDIPGDAGVKSAPLIVAMPRTVVTADIVQPRSGRAYAPGEDLTLTVSTRFDGPTVPLREEWSVREGDAWTVLDGDELELPWTDDEASVGVRVRLYEADGYLAASDEATVTVRNRSGFKWLLPRQGSSVRPGSTTTLAYEAADACGRRAIVSAWYESRDGETWTPATVTWGYWWRAPQPTGPLYLKAVWTTAAGHTSESILELTIDKRPGRY